MSFNSVFDNVPFKAVSCAVCSFSTTQAYPDIPQKVAATGHTAAQDSGLKTPHNPQVSETPGHIFPICLHENCRA